ncbi:hypothetical protein RugamoR57_11930 [Duganella caerulea]
MNVDTPVGGAASGPPPCRVGAAVTADVIIASVPTTDIVSIKFMAQLLKRRMTLQAATFHPARVLPNGGQSGVLAVNAMHQPFALISPATIRQLPE